jgi:hypothetical protein
MREIMENDLDNKTLIPYLLSKEYQDILWKDSGVLDFMGEIAIFMGVYSFFKFFRIMTED